MAEVNLTLGDPIEVKVAPAEGATNVTVSPAPLNVVQVQTAIATNSLAGPAGPGVPSGGTENQFIQKGDGGEYDTKFSAYTLPGVDGDEKQVFVANGDGTTSWDYVESTFLQVENAESSAISAGTVVYAFGVSGNNITVKRADARTSATMPAIGIVLEEIAAGSSGEIITSGLFNKTISGLSGISVGDTVYVSETAGEVTTTKPTGTALIQNIGIVLKTNSNNIQKMKVSAIDRVNDIPNIPDGQAWIGNASGVPTPTTLANVATSGDYNDLSNTPSVTDTNTTYSVSTADGDDASEKKIVLTDSDSVTDDVVLKASGSTSLTRDGEKIVISSTDTDTTYVFRTVDGDNADEEILRLRDGSSDQDIILEAGTGLSISNDNANNKITFTNTSSSTDTNLGSDDLTLSGPRTLEMNGRNLTFENSSVETAKIFANGTASFTGRVTIDGNDTVGGAIRLKEADGTSILSLQAPTNLSSNVTFTLPDSDGTADQVLKTNGSGTLSFASPKFENVYCMSFVDDLGTAKHYLPWKDINEQTTIYQEEAAMLMPYDGRIKSVSVRANSVSNLSESNMTISVHTHPTGISPFAGANWTSEEGEVLSVNGADDYHTFHFVFSNAQHFEAGDLCAIGIQTSVDLTSASSYWYVTTVVEYDPSSQDLGSSSTEHGSNP